MQEPTKYDSIFWIETDKIEPNPFQPRHEFDEERLKALAESIRQYGVLQPLVVTRKEVATDDGGLRTYYELISGERRLRASKIAGTREVPVIIREQADDDRVKLELAIIENLQREDLNPVDRAKAFKRLADDFGFKHHEIAEKVGKSRVYVTNSLRILDLPQEMVDAVAQGQISEGHTRPLLMLSDRPEEQATFFKEILLKKLNVREAESVARNIAVERSRKFKKQATAEILGYQNKLAEMLGTRVSIEESEQGGKIHIDFFSPEDVKAILELVEKSKNVAREVPKPEAMPTTEANQEIPKLVEESQEKEEDIYNIKNFSV